MSNWIEKTVSKKEESLKFKKAPQAELAGGGGQVLDLAIDSNFVMYPPNRNEDPMVCGGNTSITPHRVSSTGKLLSRERSCSATKDR